MYNFYMNSNQNIEKNTNIKVLLVLPFFYPHRGGSQKYAEEIYAIMMKYHSDVKVDVLAYNTDKTLKYEDYRGFRVYRVPCWNVIPARFALANPISLLLMLIKLSKNKYDYTNTHIRFFDPTWWLWIYAKLIGAKSFYTGHVAIHPVHQNKIVEIVSVLVDKTLARISLKFYDLITYTNKTAQKFFKESLWVKKETYVVYGGIDTTFFKPAGQRTNRILPKLDIKVDDDTVLITFVGRMIWTKGITYYYESIKEVLSKTNKKVLFVLGGPGELEEQIRNQINADNIGDKVVMTGDLQYEQVRDLLSISDVFVNPSHHNEGFPNTVLEGGASGCYVIATDNAGTWEVVRNRETGQLVPQKDSKTTADAILWALDNEEERKSIANRFRKELVEGFDWKVISDQLYELLMSKKG